MLLAGDCRDGHDHHRKDRHGFQRIRGAGVDPAAGQQRAAAGAQKAEADRGSEIVSPCTASECPRMQDEARAFWVTAPGRGEIRCEALGTPSNGEVLVQAMYSAISRGPRRSCSTAGCRRANGAACVRRFSRRVSGTREAYGASNVGRVMRGPHALTGRTVFVLHPHQTRFIVPAEAVHAAAGRSSAGPRGAGRESRDGAQRCLGRQTACWRSYPR